MSARDTNGDLPIYRLPPELLMAILYGAREWRVADIRLGHVCHYWRTLLLAMPEFWASMLKDLELSVHPVYLGLYQHCLTHSSPRPIEVRAYFNGDIEGALLLQHASRIVHLTVHFVAENGARALEELLDSGMSGLLTLTIDHHHARQLSRPLWQFPLSALGELNIPGPFPLQMWVVPTLHHIGLNGQPTDALSFWEALSRCRSLTSLAFRPGHQGKSGLPPSGSTYLEHPPKDGMPSLRLHWVDITGCSSEIVTTLAQLSVLRTSSARIRLNIQNEYVSDIVLRTPTPTLLSRDVLPALTCLSLAPAHSQGGVRLLGLTEPGHGAERYEERLEVRYGWIATTLEDPVTMLLRPFADTQVQALVIGIPHLPFSLDRSAWGRRLAGPGRDAFSPPRALRRLELLGGTSAAAKVRFARWFVGGPDSNRPPANSLTLCWVLDVSRTKESENRAYEELSQLEQLLVECTGAQRPLGRLELNGTTQSGVRVVHAGQLSTNTARFREVAGAFISRFEGLVGKVVII